MTASALYMGQVVHRRFKPKRHRLAYDVFSLLLNLDEIDACDARLKWFSRNRFNLFSFHDKDHGDASGRPLRAYAEHVLHQAGQTYKPGDITLLCYPRILGYVFNPLSVYFCHDETGRLRTILYEVSNTFGERHSYCIPVEEGQGGIVRQTCDKVFYVSPFMEMDCRYAFRITPPAGSVTLGIHQTDEEGALLNAVFTGRREALTDAALRAAFFRYPLMTFKIMGGIHWEALKLFLKGVKLTKRPPAPENPVTVIANRPEEGRHATSSV